MFLVQSPFILILIRCFQASRDEADESDEALRSVGGLLQKYVVKPHASEEQTIKDPGLDLTVQQTVTLRHGGTGTRLQKQQRVNNGTGSVSTEAPITEEASDLDSGLEAPFTPQGTLRNTGLDSATPAEKLLRDRSILGEIDPEENKKEAETLAWNPDAMCCSDEERPLCQAARYWADALKRGGLTEWRARKQVMEKWSRKFISWNPYKVLSSRTGETADAAAARHVQQGGLTLDAARQLVMYEYPDKFPIGGKACAFVVDGGSSGGRLYRFTDQEFCPKAIEIPLKCDEEMQETFDDHIGDILAFAGQDTARGNVLRFRDVIGVMADLDFDLPDWLRRKQPLIGDRESLCKCYLYSLASTLPQHYGDCARSSLFVGVTAGLRDFMVNASRRDLGRDAQRVINEAVDRFNRELKQTMRDYAPRTRNRGGLQILPISREGRMEAQSVKLAAQVSGDSEVSEPGGVFSMGGKSAQFSSFGSDEYTLLLTMGHLRGRQILDEAFDAGLTEAPALRARFSEELTKILKVAKQERDAPNADRWEEFTEGTWIGIQGAAWSAVTLGILEAGHDRHDPVTRQTVKDALEVAFRLQPTWKDADRHYHGRGIIDPEGDWRRDLAQLLIMDFWMEKIFSDRTMFYFRKDWKTKSGRCLKAEWAFDAAQLTQPLLSQALQDEADSGEDED